jgi:glycosyltransferase involved in cell wall biosynthesis
LVSIITPTYGREKFIPAIADCVRRQTFENYEWLVLDDSEEPSTTLSGNSWDKLKYLYSRERLNIGEKRNRLVDLARGEIILHFDDDDFYGRDYILRTVRRIQENGVDISLLSGFFAVHLDIGSIGFYRTLVKKGAAFAFSSKGAWLVDLGEQNIPLIHLCYGWALAYRKNVWADYPFKHVVPGEDKAFLLDAGQKYQIDFSSPERLDCFHSVHSHSTTICYPQFNLPIFVFRHLSADAYQHFVRLRRIVEKQTTPMENP